MSPSRSAGNRIGDDGCKGLAEALESNTSVTSVKLYGMLVYDWGVVGHACVLVDMTGGMRGAGDEVFLRGRSVKQRSVHEEYALVVRFRGGGGSDDVLLHDDTSAETRPHTHCSVEWSTFPPPSPLHSSHELPPKGRVPGDCTLRIRRFPIIAVCALALFCVRMTWQWHSAVPCGTVGRGLTKGQQQRVSCVGVCRCGCV